MLVVVGVVVGMCVCIGDRDPGRGNNVPKSQGVPGAIAVGPAMSDEKEQRGWGLWSVFQRQWGTCIKMTLSSVKTGSEFFPLMSHSL